MRKILDHKLWTLGLTIVLISSLNLCNISIAAEHTNSHCKDRQCEPPQNKKLRTQSHGHADGHHGHKEKSDHHNKSGKKNKVKSCCATLIASLTDVKIRFSPNLTVSLPPQKIDYLIVEQNKKYFPADLYFRSDLSPPSVPLNPFCNHAPPLSNR